VAVASDGSLFVTNFGILAGQGEVVKINAPAGATGSATLTNTTPVSGTLTGKTAGAFQDYTINYPGGSVVGTIANRAIGGPALLAIFAAVMLVAARATWQRAGSPAAEAHGCPGARARVLVPLGFGVGALTGLVGVGGGFVVVPALAIGLSFGMREAMGTSMIIVAAVSACGLAAHLAAGNAFDVPVALQMGAATIAGALAGPRLAARVPTRSLGRAFSLLVAAVALGVLGAALT